MNFIFYFLLAINGQLLLTRDVAGGLLILSDRKQPKGKRPFLQWQQVLMLDLVEKRLFSQQEPRRTINSPAVAFIGKVICGVGLSSGKAALLTVHTFVMQEEISVSPAEEKLTQWT